MDKVYVLLYNTLYDGWFIKMIGDDRDDMRSLFANCKTLFPDRNWDLQEWTLNKADAKSWDF